jgi:hypothetical protein
VESAEQAGFDLDEVTAADLDAPERPPARYDLADLGALLARPELLPPGIQTKALGPRDWSWQAPGMPAPVRVTTNPDYYEQHPDSTELWSPGSPVFPVPQAVADSEEVAGADFRSLVAEKSATTDPTDRRGTMARRAGQPGAPFRILAIGEIDQQVAALGRQDRAGERVGRLGQIEDVVGDIDVAEGQGTISVPKHTAVQAIFGMKNCKGAESIPKNGRACRFDSVQPFSF